MKRWVGDALGGAVVGALVFAALIAVRFWRHHDEIWLAGYRQWLRESAQTSVDRKPIHVMVFIADHFEPSYFDERTRRWEVGYPAFAERHRDHEGRAMQHTWFFPGDQLNNVQLEKLAGLVGQGFGEVELHYHHGFDTYESFQRRLTTAIAAFQRYGFLRTVDGRTQFGFVHGNFGLDNSEGPAMCGVNEEIKLLLSMGCFADFTFPAIQQQAQPRTVNNIYEAMDDPGPKSYDTVYPLTGTPSPNRLTIFQGPLVVYYAPWTLYRVEDGYIHASVPTTAKRVDMWIRAGIHVAQRPNWIFVKLWTHGAESEDEIAANLGVGMDAAMFYLEAKYNDGTNYVLHYVTAREAYNVARAAAAGVSGDPPQYYDYLVKPYVADHVNGDPKSRTAASRPGTHSSGVQP